MSNEHSLISRKQILEGNIAIAKFVGINTNPSELKYHTDWNWLIPVVTKIYFMPFNENQGWEIEGLPFVENDILSVWKSVANFCIEYINR